LYIILTNHINTMGYSNYYPHPPVEEPWNNGISRGGGVLTLEFPGEGCINLGISRGEVH
jgi:hypothetical protein